MVLKRLIPCLDVDRGRVVKGTNFVDIRDAGDPVELAVHYDREGADEIVFLDITASHEGRETIVDLASSPEVDGVTGGYFVKCRKRSSAKATYDAEAAKRLWEESEKLTGTSWE